MFYFALELPEISEQYIEETEKYERKKSSHQFQCNVTLSNNKLSNGHGRNIFI